MNDQSFLYLYQKYHNEHLKIPEYDVKKSCILLNMFLDNLKTKVYEAHCHLSENEKLITAETLKNKFLGKDERPRMLIEIFADHNKKMAVLLGKEFANGTLERYKTSLRHTQEFLNARYGISDIDIKKIDYSFITEYDFYLRSVHKCSNNTTVKYLINFGKIIRICLSNSWIVSDPFANYKGKIKTIDRIYLLAEELVLQFSYFHFIFFFNIRWFVKCFYHFSIYFT